jgi:hypothetical protein
MTMANDSTIYNPSSQATLGLPALYQDQPPAQRMSARRDPYYHRMNCRLLFALTHLHIMTIHGNTALALSGPSHQRS